MIKIEHWNKVADFCIFSTAQFVESASRCQFLPLLDFRADCFLFFAPFLTSASLGDDSLASDRLDPPLVACFLTGGSSGDDSSALDRLELLLAVSFSTLASSGDDSLLTGLFVPLLVSFLTAGVLGFLEGAPLFTGVSLGVAGDSFLETDCFLPELLGKDATFSFLAGDFLVRGRPRPLAFDWLVLWDFLVGGGRRALGGGLFWDFLRANSRVRAVR